MDYAHNPAALAATLRTLHRLWGPDRCVAAVTLPGDRRDDLLAASRPGGGRRGQPGWCSTTTRTRAGAGPGRCPRWWSGRCAAAGRQLRAVRADGYREAVVEALGLAGPGDVVLVLYERLAPVLDVLAELGAVRGAATPVPALPLVPAAGARPAPARDLVRGALQG